MGVEFTPFESKTATPSQASAGVAYSPTSTLKSGLLGIYRGLRDVIDDATMNALFDQEAKTQQANSAEYAIVTLS